MRLESCTSRFCIGGVYGSNNVHKQVLFWWSIPVLLHCMGGVCGAYIAQTAMYCIVLVEYDEANIVHAVVALHWWSM